MCVDGEVTDRSGAVMTVVAWMNGGEMVLALSGSEWQSCDTCADGASVPLAPRCGQVTGEPRQL